MDGLGEDELDLLNGSVLARFLQSAASWDLGDNHGAVAQHSLRWLGLTGTATRTSGCALDTGSDVELGTRCSMHEKEITQDLSRLGMVFKSRSYN